jgi:membrane protein DedA with SNARE-associated domain
MISISELLDRYGYAAVLLGTFVEGETILILGGFAAHQGYLSFPGVVAAAFVGSVAGDQTAFFVGRRYGQRLLERWPRFQGGVARATALLTRHETPLLLGFRFVYGIRNVTPIAAGLGKIRAPRFVLFNLIGALAWSALVAAVGYAFGRGFVLVVERARRFEEHAMFTILGLGLLWLGGRYLSRRAAARTRRS